MTRDEFWHNGMDAFRDYFFGNMIKSKQVYDWIDVAGHLFGAYNSKALSSVPIVALPIMEKISNSKLKKMLGEYPKKPFNISHAEKEKEIEQEKSKVVYFKKATDEEIAEHNKKIQAILANTKK